MNVVFLPCSNKGKSMGNFKRMVEDWIQASLVENARTDNPSEFPNSEIIRLWWLLPGKNEREWGKMEKGDVVLFYRDRKFFHKALVRGKFHDRMAAETVAWKDESGRTWEYMFVLEDWSPISVPFQPCLLSKDDWTSYSEDYVIQGGKVLSEKNSQAILRQLEEYGLSEFDEESVTFTEEEGKAFDSKLKDPKDAEEAKREIRKITQEIAKEPAKEIVKIAKMIARNAKYARLVKESASYVCEICWAPPFRQKNWLPYAEAHHKSELAKSKLDVPEDMVCLCPTCHRVVHFWTDEELGKRKSLKPSTT